MRPFLFLLGTECTFSPWKREYNLPGFAKESDILLQQRVFISALHRDILLDSRKLRMEEQHNSRWLKHVFIGVKILLSHATSSKLKLTPRPEMPGSDVEHLASK